MLHQAKSLNMPSRTTISAGFSGKLYPAWIERWSRRVSFAGGPVGHSVCVVLYVDGKKFRKAHHELWDKLQRWGYSNVVCKKRSQAHGDQVQDPERENERFLAS
ncbi:MAG: hypothetical protein H0U85_00050 [Gemmatimonadales bacterium]|nr:hypothetical protein [Gemmatimonadales bacterium]